MTSGITKRGTLWSGWFWILVQRADVNTEKDVAQRGFFTVVDTVWWLFSSLLI